MKLLKCDKLLITKEGLQQLIQNLKDRTELLYVFGPRFQREIKPSEVQRQTAFKLKPRVKEIPKYDPSQPLDFKFKVLQDYLKEYEKIRSGESVSAKEEARK